MTWSRERLMVEEAGGASSDYVFFWGHTPMRDGIVDPTCFSQWFSRGFDVEGVRYRTAEHFMMAAKADLFGDDAARSAILMAETPAAAKALGRAVQRFDESRWEHARSDIVLRGNLAKFGQHEDLRAYLLSTGEKVLVEASPHDRIWGIGMRASNPDARIPARWRGANLLGFALMEVRERLRGTSAK
jgi:ribA/ribD-fused uncharacterized protein